MISTVTPPPSTGAIEGLTERIAGGGSAPVAVVVVVVPLLEPPVVPETVYENPTPAVTDSAPRAIGFSNRTDRVMNEVEWRRTGR